MRIQILILGFRGLSGVRLGLRRRMTKDKRSTKFKHLRKKKTIHILVLRDPLFITSLFGTKAFNINSAFSPRVMKANVKSHPGGWGWPVPGGSA